MSVHAMKTRTERALVVDDLALNRFALRELLAREGFDTDEARSLDEARRALSTGTYDLVLLDMYLDRDRDGIELLGHIRSRPELRDVPVLLVSSYANDDDSVARGLRAGADDYITRPVGPSVLAARIEAAQRARARVRQAHRATGSERAMVEDTLAELTNAAAVQRAALPKVPVEAPRVTVTGAVVPSSLVSGDLFDVVNDVHGGVSAVLIDVAGHGAPAALIASAARDAVRRGLEAGLPLDGVIAGLESCLASQGDVLEAIAAIAILRFQPSARTVEVLNAGLVPIALVQQGVPVKLFASRSPPPGMMLDREHPYDVVPLRGEGVFVLMSDGLTGGDDDESAVESLCERMNLAAVTHAAAKSPRSAIEALVRENAPTLEGALVDDATLVLAGFDARLVPSPNDLRVTRTNLVRAPARG